MLAVSPPTDTSNFEQLYSAFKSEMVTTQEPILGGGWDEPLFSPIPPVPSTSASVLHSPARSRDCIESASLGLLIRSKYQGWERSFELHHDWPLPRIENPDEVLIRNVSVGLNPVDFKSVLYNFGISGTPWILGRDIAGVVEKVGDDVKDLQVGERVWLCADSRDIRSGAYQAYSIARRVHIGKISKEITDEQAATLGTGLVTAAIVAYWFFEWSRAESLPGVRRMPGSSRMDHDIDVDGRNGDWVLIYGGGSITGIYLMQLAKISNLRVISIASPSNFDYLTSLGATHCVDRYLEPEEIQEKVLEHVRDEGIAYCLDAVGSKTATTCHGILCSAGKEQGQMICLAGDPKSMSINENHNRSAKMRRNAAGKRSGVDIVKELNRNVKVHKISFSTTFYGDDLFAKSVTADLNILLQQKELIPARIEVWPDGLAGVRGGLEALRDNLSPRGKKLVVNLADTPHADLTNLGVRSELGWNGMV